MYGCDWGWCWGQSLPSSSRYIFIFLIADRQGQSLVLQGLHDMTWVVLSLLNVWIPLIVFTFTSMSTVSNGSRCLSTNARSCILIWEYRPSGKLACIVIHSFCNIVHTVSCAPVAKVYHIIPCLIIMWKSMGSFFIKHLILSLSLSLIVTTLGKLIWLSLKVTLTSFQSISRVSPNMILI